MFTQQMTILTRTLINSYFKFLFCSFTRCVTTGTGGFALNSFESSLPNLITARLTTIATLGLFLSLERHSRCGWSPTTRQYTASKVQANLIVYQILLTHMFMLQAYNKRNILQIM